MLGHADLKIEVFRHVQVFHNIFLHASILCSQEHFHVCGNFAFGLVATATLVFYADL